MSTLEQETEEHSPTLTKYESQQRIIESHQVLDYGERFMELSLDKKWKRHTESMDHLKIREHHFSDTRDQRVITTHKVDRKD